MFKITKTNGLKAHQGMHQELYEPDTNFVSRYCNIESWSADLASGIFRLGPVARQVHGMGNETEYGLLNLIRRYNSKDRKEVLELFEMAATVPTSFCFSTTALSYDHTFSSLTCIGESSNFQSDGNGSMGGIFIFPEFELNFDSQHKKLDAGNIKPRSIRDLN